MVTFSVELRGAGTQPAAEVMSSDTAEPEMS